ncbi:hypothetical protein RJJ65_35155, partial [Rhizobium hidalgonense]|nr:hypothetical protein [Rhizobium hidalgonense]
MHKNSTVRPVYTVVKLVCFSTLVIGYSYAATATPTSQNTSSAVPMLSYPTADAQLGERLYPNEAMYSQQIGVELEKLIRKRDAGGVAQRDVHAKAHGCVKAQLTILDQIPANLKKG